MKIINLTNTGYKNRNTARSTASRYIKKNGLTNVEKVYTEKNGKIFVELTIHEEVSETPIIFGPEKPTNDQLLSMLVKMQEEIAIKDIKLENGWNNFNSIIEYALEAGDYVYNEFEESAIESLKIVTSTVDKSINNIDYHIAVDELENGFGYDHVLSKVFDSMNELDKSESYQDFQRKYKNDYQYIYDFYTNLLPLIEDMFDEPEYIPTEYDEILTETELNEVEESLNANCIMQ